MGEADERKCPDCRLEFIVTNYCAITHCSCGAVLRPKYMIKESAKDESD